MRWPISSGADAAALAVLALAPLRTSAGSASLDCKNIVAGDQKFDLSELKGPHTITTSEHHPPTFSNTTYTIDICQPLKRSQSVSEDEKCPNGTHVCAIKHLIDNRKDEKDRDSVEAVFPIAGSLQGEGGKSLDAEFTRLKTSEQTADADKVGVRVLLRGGYYEQREQYAVVEFLCDPARTGTEGEWESGDKYEQKQVSTASRLQRSAAGLGPREDGKSKDEEGSPEKQLKKDDNPALVWESHGPDPQNAKVDVLRLIWHTKYACEERSDVESPAASASWGFFTWLIIIVFLSTAAYLIFGSWLNYTRYGARGWDLLPHGDTLQDLPYLLKDWIRRLLNTVQGSGSRGGYSAV